MRFLFPPLIVCVYFYLLFFVWGCAPIGHNAYIVKDQKGWHERERVKWCPLHYICLIEKGYSGGKPDCLSHASIGGPEKCYLAEKAVEGDHND